MPKKKINKIKTKQKQKQKQKQSQNVIVNIHKSTRTRKPTNNETPRRNVQQLPTPQYIYTSQTDNLVPQMFNKQGQQETLAEQINKTLDEKINKLVAQYTTKPAQPLIQPTQQDVTPQSVTPQNIQIRKPIIIKKKIIINKKPIPIYKKEPETIKTIIQPETIKPIIQPETIKTIIQPEPKQEPETRQAIIPYVFIKPPENTLNKYTNEIKNKLSNNLEIEVPKLKIPSFITPPQQFGLPYNFEKEPESQLGSTQLVVYNRPKKYKKIPKAHAELIPEIPEGIVQSLINKNENEKKVLYNIEGEVPTSWFKKYKIKKDIPQEKYEILNTYMVDYYKTDEVGKRKIVNQLKINSIFEGIKN